MEKSCRKSAPKASARPLFNFVNNPKQTPHARIFFKEHILKEDCRKALKSQLYFFFQIQSLLTDSNTVLFNKVIKNKRGQELVTSRSSGYGISSEKFIY